MIGFVPSVRITISQIRKSAIVLVVRSLNREAEVEGGILVDINQASQGVLVTQI